MTCATFLRAAMVTLLFVVIGVPAEPPRAQKEATVWALPDTKVYHCPGSKLWHGLAAPRLFCFLALDSEEPGRLSERSFDRPSLQVAATFHRLQHGNLVGVFQVSANRDAHTNSRDPHSQRL